jgi:hypothetical protein
MVGCKQRNHKGPKVEFLSSKAQTKHIANTLAYLETKSLQAPRSENVEFSAILRPKQP